MITAKFPHSETFRFGDRDLSASEVLSLLESSLTPDRQEKIKAVIEQRTLNVVPVLEDIYDRGNVSAVLRSAEAMGCQVAHVIELNEKFKESARVTKGADKWLDIKKWKSTQACVANLKANGYRILATHLDAKAKPIGEIDVTVPTAIVFGNEKDGISKEMAELADQTVIIPMQGFVQSYNISVAAAISLYHIFSERGRKFKNHGDMTEEEKLILRAEYCLRSSKNPEALILELLSRKASDV